jgi:hypothetical protein
LFGLPYPNRRGEFDFDLDQGARRAELLRSSLGRSTPPAPVTTLAV